MARPYQTRLVDPLLTELLAEVPAVSLVGPRASGKTTTAARHAATVIRLDTPSEAAAFRANPDAALRGLVEPVLLDEWQEAPEVLGAVKRAVDADPAPGRFLLTGSVRAELEGHTWPGTGRVIHVPMTGLTVRERLGDATAEPFLDRLLRDGAAACSANGGMDVSGYLDLLTAGSFPEPALRLSPRGRQRWFEGYVSQMLTRDVEAIGPHRDPVRLRRYFETLALNTAGSTAALTLYQAAGVDRRTADAYERLLRNMFVVDAVPAWFSNRLKRLAQLPKRYLVDPALGVAALGLDSTTLLRDGDVLGRMIDTFVAAQLRAELPVSSHLPRLRHLRQQDGRHEVDLLVEFAGRRVVAIEVKSSSAPERGDASHLVWLRDQLGDRFAHGLVLHTGRMCAPMGDRITAAPISTLWS